MTRMKYDESFQSTWKILKLRGMSTSLGALIFHSAPPIIEVFLSRLFESSLGLHLVEVTKLMTYF